MNPEDKVVLERVKKLAEENNSILRNMQRAARWGQVWGFIKLLILVVPLVFGYFYLEPYIKELLENYRTVTDAFNSVLPQ